MYDLCCAKRPHCGISSEPLCLAYLLSIHTRSQFSASAMDLNDATVLSHPTHVTKNKPGV